MVGFAFAGRIHFFNPILAISDKRSFKFDTDLNSPVSATSPITAIGELSAMPFNDDSSATAIPKSKAGSFTFKPPMMVKKTSFVCSFRFKNLSMAAIIR